MISRGVVVALYISINKGMPMHNEEEVRAIAGVGLAGDRYALGKGAWSGARAAIRHVSLISLEAVGEANRATKSAFLFADTRRNIVTQGVNLNDLVGKVFQIGPVQMRGVERCDPCARPSTLSGKRGFAQAFEGIGGLRAEILNDGKISVGDEIFTP